MIGVKQGRGEAGRPGEGAERRERFGRLQAENFSVEGAIAGVAPKVVGARRSLRASRLQGLGDDFRWRRAKV